MSQIVDVPGQGEVEFPDSMKDEEIVAAIKRLSAPPQPAPITVGERLKNAAHGAAALLPTGGMILGGALGATAGTPADLLTGPLGTVTGGAIGAGLGSAGGKSLQHAIDSALGYEQPDIAATTKDSLETGGRDAAVTAGFGMAAPIISNTAQAGAGAASRLLKATPRVAEHLPYVGKGLRLLRMIEEAKGEAPAAPPPTPEPVPDPLESVRMPQSNASLSISNYQMPTPPAASRTPGQMLEALTKSQARKLYAAQPRDPLQGLEMPIASDLTPSAARELEMKAVTPGPATPRAATVNARPPPAQTLTPEQLAAQPHEPQMAGESFGKGPSRLQRGATKAQLEYRAKLFGGQASGPVQQIGASDLSTDTLRKLRDLTFQPKASPAPASNGDALLQTWRQLRSPEGGPKLLELLEEIRKAGNQ